EERPEVEQGAPLARRLHTDGDRLWLDSESLKRTPNIHIGRKDRRADLFRAGVMNLDLARALAHDESGDFPELDVLRDGREGLIPCRRGAAHKRDPERHHRDNQNDPNETVA